MARRDVCMANVVSGGESKCAFHDNAPMRILHSNIWLIRLAALVLSAAAAASAVFWVLRIKSDQQAYQQTGDSQPRPAMQTGTADTGLLARALGGSADIQENAAAPAAEKASGRFALVGVIAYGAESAASLGSALISVDGKAPKAYRIGAALADGWMLKSVANRKAELSCANCQQESILLQMPEPKSAASRPAPMSAAMPAAAVPMSAPMSAPVPTPMPAQMPPLMRQN